MKHSSNLDLLRSTAVLVVLFGHTFQYSGINFGLLSRWHSEIDELTYFAVLMFFIHTSLVLMMSFRRLEQSFSRGVTWRFYIRRIARIYPLSILVVCLCYAFHIPRFAHDAVCGGGALEKVSNLLLTQNLTSSCPVSGPLWSLPYEMQMYAILPFAYWLGKRLRYPVLLLAGGFALWYVSRKVIPLDLLRFAPWFSMGIYAFFRRTKQILPSWTFYVALLLLIAARPAAHQTHHYVSGWIVFAAGIAFCSLLPMFRDIKTRFVERPAALIAKYSYGIYLVHAPLMWLVFVRMPGVPVALQAGIFLSMVAVCAVLLYHAIEAPMIRLGVHLTRNPGQGPRVEICSGLPMRETTPRAIPF